MIHAMKVVDGYSTILITKNVDGNRIIYDFEWKASNNNPKQCAIHEYWLLKHANVDFVEAYIIDGEFKYIVVGVFNLKVVGYESDCYICENIESA